MDNENETWYQKHPLFSLIGGALIITLVTTCIAWVIADRAGIKDFTLNFFAQFGGAMISACLAAYFVIYQAKKAREDVSNQIEESKRAETIKKYETVRPTIFAMHSVAPLKKGDKVFIFDDADILTEKRENMLKEICEPNNKLEMLIIRFFDGQPIYNVNIHTFNHGDDHSKDLSIPYLKPGQKNVIFTYSAFKINLRSGDDKNKDKKYGTQTALWSPQKNKPVPGFTLEYSTVMKERVTLTYTATYVGHKNGLDGKTYPFYGFQVGPENLKLRDPSDAKTIYGDKAEEHMAKNMSHYIQNSDNTYTYEV